MLEIGQFIDGIDKRKLDGVILLNGFADAINEGTTEGIILVNGFANSIMNAHLFYLSLYHISLRWYLYFP